MKIIMLPVRNRIFQSEEDADFMFSRLDWRVEKVQRLTNSLLKNSTIDTDRPWVGRINREKKEFEITQTSPFFSPRLIEGIFFTLFVYGRIRSEGQKSEIVLKFRLGWMTTALFVFMYLSPVVVLVSSWSGREADWNSIFLSLLVPMFLTFLLIIQLNRTENRLIDLFEV